MTSQPHSPVSVVIPCYNQARYLAEAIDSALSQEAGAPEVIVVDDGSADATPDVVGRYPGVRLVRQKNSGVSLARNAGFQASSQPYLVFLDADDRLAPNALGVGLAALESHPEAACAFGLCRVIGPDGNPQPFQQQRPVQGDPYAALLRGNFVWMPAEVIYRREAFAASGGFDPEIPAAADYDLYLRLAHQHPVVVHREVVADYRMHGEKMSGNALLMFRSTLKALERQWPRVKGQPEYRAAYLWGHRFCRDFWADRVVEEIRASLRVEGRRRRALASTLALLRHHPRAVALQLFRKLRNMARLAVADS